MNTRFSDRHGLQPPDAQITIRQGAPEELRSVLVDLAYECGLTVDGMRTLVCRVLRKKENKRGNWSRSNVDDETRGHLEDCAWHEVYDVVETLYQQLSTSWTQTSQGHPGAQHFENELNKYFRREGIGWQLKNGLLEARGAEEFEHTLAEARQELADSGRTTASNEIHEAITDLSRRPQPDVTGAIQHSLAALECVARDVTGDPKATLGAILSKHPGLIPLPLDDAIKKLWGFASEQGRHLQEGRVPGYEEAEVAVQVAAAVARYLSKKAGS